MTIKELHQKFIKKELSPVEVVKDYFKKIKKEDKEIHSFLTLIEEKALLEAKKAEEVFLRAKTKDEIEKIPLLCGIPCAIKDNILIEDIKCTAGSKILEDYIAPYDATVIKKLKNLGVVFLGKTNMDEFAMGASTETSAYGATHNPIDKTRVPGGSSGGSAAAVAADFCQFALGSDTGGSIRQPASFCGVVGLKPTYGTVSRYGLIAMASSLDQVGPITKNVEDAKIVFEAIKGKDPLDSTSVESKIVNCKLKIENLRIGVPKEYFVEGIEKEVKREIEKAIEKFQKLGAKIENISLPHTKYALATYYLIMPSEVSSNMARYDGMRYGKSVTRNLQLATHNLFEVYSKTRGEYFGREVKRRILLGTFALSAGYYDQYYLKARMVRELIKKDFENAFKKVDAVRGGSSNGVDLILTPVSPTTAFKIGENINDPVKMYLADIFTVGVSLAGLPALSLPCAKSKEGLPIGLQIIGRPFEENIIFEAAKEFENS